MFILAVASALAFPTAIVMTLGTFWAAVKRAWARSLANELVAPRNAWALKAMARRSGGDRGAWVASLAPLQEGSRLLDLAGGTGALIDSVAAKIGPSGHVTIVDSSEAALALCAQEHQTQVSAGHVDLRVGRVDQPLPFDSGAFDVVFAVEILHMLKPDSWPAAVREWARCVKPGGRLIIVNPGNLDSVYQAGLLQQVYFGVSLAQLKSLMQAGGLLDVQTLRRGEQEDLLAACIGTAPHSSQQQRKQRREDEDRFQGNVAFT